MTQNSATQNSATQDSVTQNSVTEGTVCCSDHPAVWPIDRRRDRSSGASRSHSPLSALRSVVGSAAMLGAFVLGGCATTDPLETSASGARPPPVTSSAASPAGAIERSPIGSVAAGSGSGDASVDAAGGAAPNDRGTSVAGGAAFGGSAVGGRSLKVALLLPLGGFDQTAVIAKGMKQAAELALFDADRSDIQLIVKDDKGTPDGARIATEEAIKDGAEVILGPLFGRAAPGAAAAARASNVPVLSFSNDRTVAGNGVYILGFSPEQDADRVIAYAARNNKQRFAAMVPDDAYGTIIGAAFKSAVAKAGGTVVAFETYPAGANAMIGPSRRIVEAARSAEAAGAPIDAVFLPGGQDVLPQLGPLLTYSGFDAGKVKLIGSGAWEFSTLGSNDAFIGGWYPGPDPAGWRAFQAKFSKSFGQAPPRVASIAYDAMQLAIALSANAPGQRFTVANLTRSGGFSGVDGTMRLTADGIAERGLAILEVQKIGSHVVERPPATVGGSADATLAGNLDETLSGARLSGTPPRVN